MKLIPIDYNGGQIWVDKEAKIAPKDSWVCETHCPIIRNNPCQVTSDYDLVKHPTDLLIVAQSTNLSLPNIPYVEIEEDVEELARQWYLQEHNKLDLKALKELEAFEAGYKAASAKKYTEEDLRAAFSAGEDYEHVIVENWYNEKQSKLPMDVEKFIQSLQPKVISIEVEHEIVNDLHSRTDTDGAIFNSNKKAVPVTYQKDGKTFLKIKSVQYENNDGERTTK